MTFDEITEDGRLWAVRYAGKKENALHELFDQWNDVMWLRAFFKANLYDLQAYYRITDVNQAIEDTLDDSWRLEKLILLMKRILTRSFIHWRTSGPLICCWVGRKLV